VSHHSDSFLSIHFLVCTISFLNPFFFLHQFNHCLTGNAFYHTQHIIANAICQRLPTQQHNKTTPPMVRQCLHPATPLLPATSPTSRSLLAAHHPTLVLAFAARRLISHLVSISAPPTVQTKQNKLSIICLHCSNTILTAPRQQLSAMANGNCNGDGQQRWQLRWPSVMKTAMANGKGDSDSDG
jgi:hypothetical protein